MKLSEQLRAENATVADAFAQHRFFAAVREGSLNPEERLAYFAQEWRFVQQAVRIFATLVVKAPSLSSQRHLAAILTSLLEDQSCCFDAVFGAIGTTTSAVGATPLTPGTVALCEGILGIASGGTYAEGLSAIYAAERTYADVASRLSRNPPPDPQMRMWFALHHASGFQSGVAWLENEIDSLTLSPSETVAASCAFGKACELEIRFHDSVLDDNP